MKRKLIAMSMIAVLAVPLGACRVTQTEEGELPEVDVDVKGGNLPEYDVDAPDVDVDTEKKKVTVPDVDIDVGTKEVEVPVPDVDVTEPGEPGYDDDQDDEGMVPDTDEVDDDEPDRT